MAKKQKNCILRAAALVGVAVGTYIAFVRPIIMRWGASEKEAESGFPGDELVKSGKINVTHAITIRASAKQVWPWLVQMGQGRGGFYTYDWIENMIGLKMRSADCILPEYQQLKVGDNVPLAPDGFGLTVSVLQPNRALVLLGDSRVEGSGIAAAARRPGDYLLMSWAFYLEEQGERITRLIERWKVDWKSDLMSDIAYRVFLEPGSYFMDRGVLEGIKARSEGAAGKS